MFGHIGLLLLRRCRRVRVVINGGRVCYGGGGFSGMNTLASPVPAQAVPPYSFFSCPVIVRGILTGTHGFGAVMPRWLILVQIRSRTEPPSNSAMNSESFDMYVLSGVSEPSRRTVDALIWSTIVLPLASASFTCTFTVSGLSRSSGFGSISGTSAVSVLVDAPGLARKTPISKTSMTR